MGSTPTVSTSSLYFATSGFVELRSARHTSESYTCVVIKSEEVPFVVPNLIGDVVGRFFFVYILRSLTDGSYYVGCTEDLNFRFNEHNNKRSKYSASKAPWELVWYGAFTNKIKAYRFERYMKEGSGFAFRNKRLI